MMLIVTDAQHDGTQHRNKMIPTFSITKRDASAERHDADYHNDAFMLSVI
jgi:hypothetical protein